MQPNKYLKKKKQKTSQCVGCTPDQVNKNLWVDCKGPQVISNMQSRLRIKRDLCPLSTKCNVWTLFGFWLKKKNVTKQNLWQSYLMKIFAVMYISKMIYCLGFALKSRKWGFPGSSAGKEFAWNAGDLGSIPGWEDPLKEGVATLEGWGILRWTKRAQPQRHQGHFLWVQRSQTTWRVVNRLMQLMQNA